jgi:ATP-binding protein involved in chromosome partitioning
MSNDLESRVWEALKTVRYPGMTRDVVSFGFVEAVTADAEGQVAVRLRMTTHKPEAAEQVRREIEGLLAELPGVAGGTVDLQLERPPAPHAGAQRAVSQGPDLVPDVRHIVAVASGKGGVGKSTVAANLASPSPSSATPSGCSTPTSTAPRCRCSSGSPTGRG